MSPKVSGRCLYRQSSLGRGFDKTGALKPNRVTTRDEKNIKLTLLTVRNIALATATVITLWLLLHSFVANNPDGSDTNSISLTRLNRYTTESWRAERKPARVVKVTALYGQNNTLYEAAIQSHAEHDRIHGYETKVLREEVGSTQWSKPAYLLSVLVQELAKPVSERAEWLMWLSPDTIILNPLIPLETFLPGSDHASTNFLGTHDPLGLNPGVFFLRVDDWSLRLLIESLAPPREAGVSALKAYTFEELESLLTSAEWRGGVVYQPRRWWNALQDDMDTFEGKKGDLLVHFWDMGGDKWVAMAKMLGSLGYSAGNDNVNATAKSGGGWKKSLEETGYEKEVKAFWDNMSEAKRLLSVAGPRMEERRIREAAERLGWVRDYQSDEEGTMKEALYGMARALEDRVG